MFAGNRTPPEEIDNLMAKLSAQRETLDTAILFLYNRM